MSCIRSLLAASVAAMSTGCLMLEADVPHACYQERGVEISVPIEIFDPEDLELLNQASAGAVVGLGSVAQVPPVDLPEGLAPISFQHSFSADGLSAIPDVFEDLGASGTVRLLEVSMDGELGQFEEIHRISLAITSSAGVSMTPPVELAVCDVAEGCDVTQERLQMRVNSDIELMSLLSVDDIELVLSLVVVPFVETWTVDVEVCMAATAEVTLSL